jgi:hypothetical protein
MSTTPPPIPEKYEAAPAKSFASRAAIGALAAPLLVAAMAWTLGVLTRNGSITGRSAPMIVAAISGLLLVIGPIFGVLALALRKEGEPRVIRRALSGLVLSGLLLSIAIPNFVNARNNALAGVGKPITRQPAQSTSAAPPSSLAGEKLVEIRGDLETCTANFRVQVNALFQSKSYDELESIAASLRSNKPKLSRGTWKLVSFYDAMCPTRNSSEQEWSKAGQNLQNWVAAQPQSATARLSYCEYWISYAWKARGSGWAQDVNESAWKLFEKRLDNCAAELKSAHALKPRCPCFYSIAQTLALGQGWDRDAYEKLFQEAVAFEPDFISYYSAKARYLQPRWHGKTDSEWLDFITSEADKRGGDEGDIFYANVVTVGFGLYDRFLQESGVKWPRLKHGLELMIERYPNDLWAKSQLCYFSGQKGEKQLTRELFLELGTNVYRPVWDKERFTQDRAWAFGL